MAAADIQIVTIVLPNPQFDQSKGAKVVSDPSLAYLLRLNTGFTTLSNNNPNNYDTIEGVLYVPAMDNNTLSQSCPGYRPLVPTNVTTINSFPTNQNWPLTAVFPWGLSDDCTTAFLAQARFDAVRSVITFQTTGGDPPARTDPSWSIRGNDSWRGDNQFPIYAINSNTGAVVLQNMGIYSGNMSTIPNSQAMSNQFNGQNFPRLFSHVDLIGGANVPSLWVFLIIVLGVLLGIVIIASIIMHIIQRYQRKNLQRRLARGEVDLETLGIKKMNVPQEIIDKMPKYTYTDTAAPVVAASATRTTDKAHVTSFSQTVCAVCLDDFVTRESDVRELPCKHIFHPECIDLFLRDSSSLCPVCKQSALPAGYCPVKVTNLMVRRERLVRRMRERREASVLAAARAAGEAPPAAGSARFPLWLQNRIAARGMPATNPAHVSGTRPAGVQNAVVAPAADVELGAMQPAQTTPVTVTPLAARRQTMAVPADVAAQGPAARRAWRRERLARQEEELYNQQAETTRAADVGRPLWRRVAGRVVPGLD